MPGVGTVCDVRRMGSGGSRSSSAEQPGPWPCIPTAVNPTVRGTRTPSTHPPTHPCSARCSLCTKSSKKLSCLLIFIMNLLLSVLLPSTTRVPLDFTYTFLEVLSTWLGPLSKYLVFSCQNYNKMRTPLTTYNGIWLKLTTTVFAEMWGGCWQAELAPPAGRSGWYICLPSSGQWVRLAEAWNWPMWEYWHHRNQQTLRTETLLACFVFFSLVSRLTFTSTAYHCVECCSLYRNTSECWSETSIWEVK